ncbi:phage tail protein [Rhodococcus sp. NPDC003994]
MSNSPALIELIGVDGSRWVLSGLGMGAEGVELKTNPRGIYDAPVKTIWNSTAFQEGATFGGFRTNKRDITFAVETRETETKSWEDVDSEWALAWSYTEDCALRITTQFGTRELKLRLSEEMAYSEKHDPHLRGVALVTMMCVAGNPYWWEPPLLSEWTSTQDTRNGSSQTGFVTVQNPTDLPMWLQWIIRAPAKWTLPDWSWKADQWASRAIPMPAQLAGEHVLVNTHPMEDQAVSLSGTQYWSRMNGQTFVHPVPKHTPPTQIPVVVTGAAAGAQVQLRCPLAWSRPWGLRRTTA